ncbi:MULTISPECIES: ABC transporter permease [unclassified Gemella]|uniref:ABC transporter permease n=1 Tax=unclassified Gemella TaxID=2624949 RepID=UPI0010734819|nr:MULTISPECIES: ABC transporter permease [unclassified Gemella]MBF0710692.1 ABC transporter permease [Gemella sp. GL1.1]MBF0746739.1 ABC transporter permease [Gemella sp. 19428wG2_WT2a]NYS28036.1 ABC transporter permease [Gemella sp. GL1]TFU60087.1 ABC transporter permease [Gemella sp. WT2a]
MFDKKSRSFFMIPYIIWMLMFVIFPILLILYYSLHDSNGEWSLVNYKEFFGKTYMWMTFYSFWYAFIITLVCLIISYPLAIIISRSKYKEILLLLLILPTWINILLKTYAFIGLFGKQGTINSFLEYIGVGTQSLLFNSFSFVFVSAYIFMPFMLLPIYNAVSGINKNVIDASYDLGADLKTTFRKIILPLSMEGVKTGIQVTFIPALSIFMITRLIAGNKIINLGTAIEQHFLVTQNVGLGSTIAVFLILIMAIIMILTNTKNKLGGRK